MRSRFQEAMTRQREAPQALRTVGTILKVLCVVAWLVIGCVQIHDAFHSRHPLYHLIPFVVFFAIIARVTYLIVRIELAKRRALQAQPGLCVNCGCDIRATPDRCPKCGRTYP